jgi:hypothetical protein
MNSHFESDEHSSDDTLLLSFVAEKYGITLNYEFSGTYTPRLSLKSLMKNGFLRGYHSIDSYFHNWNRFIPIVLLLAALPIIAPVLPVNIAFYLFTLIGIALLFLSLKRRIPFRFILTIFTITPFILIPYVSGIYFGFVLFLKKKFRK